MNTLKLSLTDCLRCKTENEFLKAGRTPKIGIQPVCYHWQNKCQTHCFSVIAYPDIHTFTELDGWKKAKKELNLSSPSSLVKNVGHYQKENVLLTGTKFASGGGGTTGTKFASGYWV